MVSGYTLERILLSGLDGVDLSSRKSNKFDAVARSLAEYWKTDASLIGVKALAATKNYGNRISEATRSEIDYLVLLAEAEVDRDGVQRALETRALIQVPTVLACRRSGHWSVEAYFIGAGQENPFGASPDCTRLAAPDTVEPDAREVSRLRQRILSLAGLPIDADIESHFTTPNALVVFKRATETKNLANRIGEAIGRRPPIFVLRASPGLCDAARRLILEQAKLSPRSRCFVVSEKDGHITVDELANTTDPAQPSNREERSNGSNLDESSTQVSLGFAEPPVRSGDKRNTKEPELQYRQLERVKQLRRHLPLDAGVESNYEELLDNKDRLRYETKTLAFLRALLQKSDRSVVVLTGNAGHGKTHLCRRILEDGDSSSDVMGRFASDPRGELVWEVDGCPLPIQMVADLSNLHPPERAAERLRELITTAPGHVVICANEGRLRDVVSHAPSHLQSLLDALERGLERGDTCLPDRQNVHVINLNHQAASPMDGGFFAHILDHFLNHQAAWNVCKNCTASDCCPIVANRNELALSTSSPPIKRRNRESLAELVRIAEEGGYVLTYRDTLVLVAYLVTGGLSCEQVEARHRKKNTRPGLSKYELTNLLFQPNLSQDEAGVLRVLAPIGRLDPGLVALRSVDERLHADLEEGDELGIGVFGEESKQLHTSADIAREQGSHRSRLRQARRIAWLHSEDGTDGLARSERLGLRFHQLFRRLHMDPEIGEVVSITRAVVRGLHTIQGAVGVDSKTSLHLVDPVFGRSSSHSAVIARSLRIKDLELQPESRWWQFLCGGEAPPILEVVDWLDRRLLLTNRRTHQVLLSLDLREFEFVEVFTSKRHDANGYFMAMGFIDNTS